MDKMVESSNTNQVQEEEIVVDKKGGTTYLKGRLLGKGGFAKCYKFLHQESKHVCAGKCVDKSSLKKERARRKLLSEIKIHRSLSHKNIVKFEHFFEDKKFVYILLEYCNNETLMELVKRKKRLPESQAKEILGQLLDGVEYLQSRNVIHRDLKLGNIFLTNGLQVRIGDFGLATKLQHADERKKTMCGTPNYIAPEVLDGTLGHSFEVDIWSLGVILYTMLVGKPPFETKNVKSTYKRIQANLYSFPAEINLSSDAKSLIRAILNRDPKMRPTLQEIREHPFFFVQHEDKENCKNNANNHQQQAQKQQPLQEETTVMTMMMKKDQTPSVADDNNKNVNASPRNRNVTEDNNPATVFVEKWIDYSSKYGVGYILKGGIIGVYFNDSTKMVLDVDGLNFQYYERQHQTYESHSIIDYPESLQKKVTLLKHFKGYLEKQQQSGGGGGGGEQVTKSSTGYDEKIALPYVRKWVRTRHAIFFRLSNRTVQVNFFDETQILLSAQEKRLCFFDKHHTMTSLDINKARQHPEIAKRLKYTKDVLNQVILTQNPSK